MISDQPLLLCVDFDSGTANKTNNLLDSETPSEINVAASSKLYPAEFHPLLLPQHGISLFLADRTKRIHFVRHAEGHHNVATRNANGQNTPIECRTAGSERYLDARLTPHGQRQCQRLDRDIATVRIKNPGSFPIDLIVTSPFTRALETAEIVFGPFDYPGTPPVLVHELCRERAGLYMCDRLRPKADIVNDFQKSSGGNVDFDSFWSGDSSLDERWSETRESADSLSERAVLFLKWLAARDEKEIAVVTHSSFLRHLFNQFGDNVDMEDQGRLQRTAGNCELRTVLLCVHSMSKL